MFFVDKMRKIKSYTLECLSFLSIQTLSCNNFLFDMMRFNILPMRFDFFIQCIGKILQDIKFKIYRTSPDFTGPCVFIPKRIQTYR